MFTNCPIDEILLAVRSEYDNHDKSLYTVKFPTTDDLLNLLNIVLDNNIFEFIGQLFKQVSVRR